MYKNCTYINSRKSEAADRLLAWLKNEENGVGKKEEEKSCDFWLWNHPLSGLFAKC